MGKNAKRRRGESIAMGLQYMTGVEAGHPLPIIFKLQYDDWKFPMRWSIKDAEAVAFSLLKSIEVAQRHEANAQKDEKENAPDRRVPNLPV